MIKASPINFAKCQLDYGTFIGLNLSKIKFEGCSLKHIEFSEANLSDANFKETLLTESRFNNTNLNGANFEGAKEYKIDITKNLVKKTRFALPEAYSLLHHIEDLVLTE